MHYLDHAATTPIPAAVAQEYVAYLTDILTGYAD